MLQWRTEREKQPEREAGLVANSLGRLIFMVDPRGFDVVKAINPHMKNEAGELQRIDHMRAERQWLSLLAAYQRLGFEVTVLRSQPECPDMVFCANQTFPFRDAEGCPAVILSNMADEVRHREVAALREQLIAHGVRCYELPERSEGTLFEGTGDALWVPGRRLICGGYGFRTSPQIYEEVSRITRSPVALFELRHPKFYHLDTCLSILDDSTALACRAGFTEEGWAQLAQIFPRLIEVPLEEADSPGFACNAHCPDQKHCIIEAGNRQTIAALVRNGFIPVEVETSEFIKSGGSVFCMKLQCAWDQWPISM